MKRLLFVLFCVAAAFAEDESKEPAIAQSYMQESAVLREKIQQKYKEAAQLLPDNATETQYLALLNDVKLLKKEKNGTRRKMAKSLCE